MKHLMNTEIANPHPRKAQGCGTPTAISRAQLGCATPPMKLNKKCWLTTLPFRQARLIVGIIVCLSSASFPVFGQVLPSNVIPPQPCKWHDAWVILTTAGSQNDKALNDALDALLKAVDETTADNAAKGVKKVIEGMSGALTHAIIVYECKDEQGNIQTYKYECTADEDIAFIPQIANSPTTKDAAKNQRVRTIQKNCRTAGCCKGKDKNTGAVTPPPAGQQPPPGAGTVPQPKPPIDLCDLKPPCPECMDLYNSKQKEIQKDCDRIKEIDSEITNLAADWLKNHPGREVPVEGRGAANKDDELEFLKKVRELNNERADLKGQLDDILKELQDCEKEKCPKNKQLSLSAPFPSSPYLAQGGTVPGGEASIYTGPPASHPGTLLLNDSNAALNVVHSAPGTLVIQLIIEDGEADSAGGSGVTTDGSSPAAALHEPSRGHWLPAAYYPNHAVRESSSGSSSWHAPQPATSSAASANVIYSIVSNGKSSGQTLELQAFDPTGKMKDITIPRGLVLEPVKQGSGLPVSQRVPRGAKVLTKQLNAYCLEYAKQPPENGMLYRIAPPDVQEKYRPIQAALFAARKLAADADTTQYTVWTILNHLDQQQFTQMFVEHTKKNAQALNVKWTKQVEEAVLKVAPEQWSKVSSLIEAARKTEGEATPPVQARP
jgi:hypothetical protein